MSTIDGIIVAINADTSSFRSEITAADKLAKSFGASLDSALSGAIIYGKNFNDVLSTLGLRLSALTLSSALKPLEQSLGSAFTNLFVDPNAVASTVASIPIAKLVPAGAGASATPTRAFASGGVIASPTYFPFGSGLGLAGERGAEAIMPLARGPDGKLGVAAQTQSAPRAITVNVSAQDAASFRRSESYLSGMIARAVARGDRSL